MNRGWKGNKNQKRFCKINISEDSIEQEQLVIVSYGK